GRVIKLLAGRLGGEQVNSAVTKGEIDLLLSLVTSAEQGGHARGRRGARSVQVGAGLGEDPFQGGEGFDQTLVLCVGRPRRGEELVIDHVEERHEVGCATESFYEREVVLKPLSKVDQIVFTKKKQSLGAEHLEIVPVEDIVEEVGLGLEL